MCIHTSMYTACMRHGSKGTVCRIMVIGGLIRSSMYTACMRPGSKEAVCRNMAIGGLISYEGSTCWPPMPHVQTGNTDSRVTNKLTLKLTHCNESCYLLHWKQD